MSEIIRDLTIDQVKTAYYWAGKRAGENIKNKWCAGNLNFEQARREHFKGTVTEDLVAREFNIKWTGRFFQRKDLDTRGHISDVGLIEVKSCPNRNGNLIIEASHANKMPYVLISTALGFYASKSEIKMRSNPRLILVGWAWGHEIKDQGDFRMSRGNQTYWMPSSKLRSFDDPEFKAVIKASQSKFGSY